MTTTRSTFLRPSSAFLGLALQGALAAAGCGAPQEAPPPEAAQKAPPPKAVVAPGDQAAQDARAAAKAGNWQQAAALFGQAADLLAQDPNGAQRAHLASVDQGIALERAGDLRAAAAIYKKALDADPKNASAALTLARVLVALQETKEAEQVANAALKGDPENPALLTLLAGVLRQNKQYEKAIDAARKILLRDQKNAPAIKILALVYADQGKHQLAETFFRNALKLDDKDASIYVNLGLIAAKRGDRQQAFKEFEAALALQPGNGAALADIGAISLRFRDYARAADAYDRAIKAGLLNCTTASALGFALEGAQRGKDAVDQLGKAHQMCPKDDELLLTMGSICMDQLRDNDCALKNFEAYTAAKKDLAADHRVFRFIETLKAQKASQPPPEAAPSADKPPAGEAPQGGDNGGGATVGTAGKPEGGQPAASGSSGAGGDPGSPGASPQATPAQGTDLAGGTSQRQGADQVRAGADATPVSG